MGQRRSTPLKPLRWRLPDSPASHLPTEVPMRRIGLVLALAISAPLGRAPLAAEAHARWKGLPGWVSRS